MPTMRSTSRSWRKSLTALKRRKSSIGELDVTVIECTGKGVVNVDYTIIKKRAVEETRIPDWLVP